jgi:hypothetical protein
MEKLDFKKRDKAFYDGKSGRWERIVLPEMSFLMIDGQGDPNGPAYARALQALYPMAYGVKAMRKRSGADFAVPPLETLWWSVDKSAFVAGDRGNWLWTAMIRVPDAVTSEMVEAARAEVLKKQAKKPGGVDEPTLRAVRLERFTEGDCLQTMHVGSYLDEAPVLADLHGRVMPDAGLTFAGKHHEIYLSDPRRVEAARLRTLLRQPVRPR